LRERIGCAAASKPLWHRWTDSWRPVKVFKCSIDYTFRFEIHSLCVFLPNLGRRMDDGRACYGCHHRCLCFVRCNRSGLAEQWDEGKRRVSKRSMVRGKGRRIGRRRVRCPSIGANPSFALQHRQANSHFFSLSFTRKYRTNALTAWPAMTRLGRSRVKIVLRIESHLDIEEPSPLRRCCCHEPPLKRSSWLVPFPSSQR